MRFHATQDGNIPFTEEEEVEADLREAEWIAGQVQRDLEAKIVKGETYIEKTISDVLETFNKKYGVAFKTIHNMGIYKDDVDYPLHVECGLLIKWQNSMWATARANQPKVLDGTMTDEEFIAALPTPPEV